MSRADFLQLRTSRWRYLGLVILPGIYFAQSVAASPWHSVTFDEQYHLTPGYVYLTQRDLRFHHDQNPPLYEAILAAPLLARSDIHLPIDHPAYQLWGDVYLFSDAFFWHSGNDADSMVQAGRGMATLTGVLLGLLLFVWGKQLSGEAAGWIALFLFVFDPNFIANAIPTLDLPLAFTVTLAMYCLWATYLFQFGPINGAARSTPVPAPQYFESFIGMFLKSSEGRANYLLGQVSTTGWWYYFIVAQDDRFGAAARMLEPGDLIVQRHPIQSEAPLKPGAYQIAIGLYNPDTLSRFKTQDGVDRLLLGTIEVKPQ